eukprot:gene10452-2974_t
MGICCSLCISHESENDEKKSLLLNDEKINIKSPRGGGINVGNNKNGKTGDFKSPRGGMKTRPIGSVSLGLDITSRKEVVKQGLLKRLKTKNNFKGELNEETNKMSQKDQTIAEFLETEMTYVNNLKIMIDYYVIPSYEYLNQEDVKIIFGNIEIVHGVNSMFLKDLEQCLQDETNLEMEFANLLKTFSASFKLYIGYISNYSNSLLHLNKMKQKNKKYFEFLKFTEQELKEKKERIIDLSSYMICPIQRLPRYRLLCEDLLKHFPKQEEELYKKLEDATKSIKEVTMYCNSKQKEIENLQKMNEISMTLGIKDLVLPSRSFVKHDDREGVLRIRDKTGGTISVVSLYLFTDLFICVSLKQTIGTKIFQIPLAPYSSNDVIRIEDLKSFENGIEIYNSTCQPLKLMNG